jgi:hypothetical protein
VRTALAQSTVHTLAEAGAHPGPTALARPSGGRTAVVCYLALALVALLPGLALKYGPALDSPYALAPSLAALRLVLEDISFGSGLRFWLGVTGATMMMLLLLYPLRKVFSKTRTAGSVGAWFHLHMLMGLAAPVLILYHCNFGHGGSNANVALWSMLAVVTSGIAGYFVYARASRDFYGNKQQAFRHRNGIIAMLRGVHADQAWEHACVSEFEAFESGLLTPRQGIVSCLVARLKVERSCRRFARQIGLHIEDIGQRGALSPDQYRSLRTAVSGHLRAYFGLARAAARQSMREQIWARWRLFHLPVFLIMIVAAVLHVIAVWDMDTPLVMQTGDARGGVVTETAAATFGTRPDAIGDIITDRASPTPPEPSAPVLTAKPQIVTRPPKSAAGVTIKRVASINLTSAEDENPKANALPGTAPANQPMPAQPMPARPQPPAAAPPSDITTVYTELQRRMEAPVMVPAADPKMGLGAVRTRSPAEQIAAFKTLIDAGQFAHRETETGFGLTGKHLKVDCTSCHTALLREVRQFSSGQSSSAQSSRVQFNPRQTNPRECISCHASDDIHNGRRPACVQCHTTNRWAQILRRR